MLVPGMGSLDDVMVFTIRQSRIQIPALSLIVTVIAAVFMSLSPLEELRELFISTQ